MRNKALTDLPSSQSQVWGLILSLTWPAWKGFPGGGEGRGYPHTSRNAPTTFHPQSTHTPPKLSGVDDSCHCAAHNSFTYCKRRKKTTKKRKCASKKEGKGKNTCKKRIFAKIKKHRENHRKHKKTTFRVFPGPPPHSPRQARPLLPRDVDVGDEGLALRAFQPPPPLLHVLQLVRLRPQPLRDGAGQPRVNGTTRGLVPGGRTQRGGTNANRQKIREEQCEKFQV